MPYMKNGKRDYKRENEWNQTHPKRKTEHSERNAARYAMEKAGKAHKGDGKDVDHVKALSKGGTNAAGNLRMRKASSNRSFKRNPDGSMK